MIFKIFVGQKKKKTPDHPEKDLLPLVKHFKKKIFLSEVNLGWKYLKNCQDYTELSKTSRFVFNHFDHG